MPNGSINVLLVEDNPADARLVEEALRDAPSAFRLSWVNRMADGLRHLRRGETDVALLDLSLPDAHGLEALTAVRAHVPNVPVVVLTGLDDEELAVRAVRDGAQDYFIKGQLHSGILTRAIRYAIERGREHALQDQLLAREREARAEAIAADKAKSDFLAMMSHEMRTPLNAIIGYAELLDMGIAGQLSPSQQQYVHRMDVSGRHLLSLINGLLDLAKIEADQLTVEVGTARCGAAIRHALALVEPQARARGLQVVSECAAADTMIYRGDRDRVHQILINLLSNAVQFTASGGRIMITCVQQERPSAGPGHPSGGLWARIAIHDTGIGIPPEHLDAIFDPFVQIQTGYTRTHGGIGLGLAISRRLARLMGGDITVESALGIGSAFLLWLPLAASGDGAPVGT